MNSDFSIRELEIAGLKLITPFYVEDSRGYFLKSIERDVFKKWGLDADIFEDFESYSRKGVIRGLHFQTDDPQIKIVRAIRGTIRDVVVDLRKNSKTFGRFVTVILSEINHCSLWVPKGFAHGFEVLSEDALVSYKCVGKYMKDSDTGIRWNDKDLGIGWQTDNPVVSQKDASLMSFKEFVDKYKGL